MQKVNPEGLYASVQAALPAFAKNGWKGRIIVVSPPIYSRFFRGKTAYAMGMEFLFSLWGVLWCWLVTGKVGMSVLTKGLAVDFVRQGRDEMAITSIWPATVRENRLLCMYMLNLLISKQAVESAATEMNPASNSGNKSDLRKAVWSIILVS